MHGDLKRSIHRVHRARIDHATSDRRSSHFEESQFFRWRGDDSLVGALLYGTTAILPLFLQNLLNYTALAAGLAMTPRGIGALAATIVVGRIVGRVSNRFLICASALLLAYACFALGNINLQVAPGNLLWPIILSGVAAASILIPLTTSAMGTLAGTYGKRRRHFQFNA